MRLNAKISSWDIINPLTGRYFYIPCTVGELFSVNLQNRGFIQTNKKKTKKNMVIWSVIVS